MLFDYITLIQLIKNLICVLLLLVLKLVGSRKSLYRQRVVIDLTHRLHHLVLLLSVPEVSVLHRLRGARWEKWWFWNILISIFRVRYAPGAWAHVPLWRFHPINLHDVYMGVINHWRGGFINRYLWGFLINHDRLLSVSILINLLAFYRVRRVATAMNHRGCVCVYLNLLAKLMWPLVMLQYFVAERGFILWR